MRRVVRPSPIAGTATAPPSKSAMIRAVAVAVLAGDETSVLLNPTRCDDALSSLAVAEALGASVDAGTDRVTIRGGLRPGDRVLDCGESGLCLRMFAAVAALAGGECTLTGREALRRRPATAIEPTLAALGASCRTEGGFPPVRVRGPLAGGTAVVDGALSSQFLSGLLIALPRAPADSTLLVRELASRPYVDLTLDLLDRFGVTIERDGYERFVIPGGQRPSVGEYRVEGDWSAAAFLFVLGAFGGPVRVGGLDPSSRQADRSVLDVLERAGAQVERTADGAVVSGGALRAFTADLTDAPDLLPPLAALACRCEGVSVLRGVGRLKHKESSRAEAMGAELGRLGARTELGADTLAIHGGPLAGGEGSAHGDHRIAMALAVAATAAEGPVTIDGTEHVTKSWPSFFDDLIALGGDA